MEANEIQPATTQQPRKRWRFSIRQLLIAIAVIAVGLFVYREVPDMVRRQVYNDPVPLIVSDRSKIHIRQIPYIRPDHFAYRIYTPPGTEYELCMGVAEHGQRIPEPALFENLDRMSFGPHRRNEIRETRLTGFTLRGLAGKNPRMLIYRWQIADGGNSMDGPLEISYPYAHGTHVRLAGRTRTDAFDAESTVVLYRQFWPVDPNAGATNNSINDGTGPGLVVWIRPKP